VTCQTCHANIVAADGFCHECGAAVGPATAVAVADPPTEVAAPTTGRRFERKFDCASCGAELRPDAKFCTACGASANGVATDPGPAVGEEAVEPAATSDAPERDVAAGNGLVAPAPSAESRVDTEAAAVPSADAEAGATPTTTPDPRFLLPQFPFRLVWSPRKPWRVVTRLSNEEITNIFTEKLTSKPSLLRRANNYWRRVRWDVQRNAISGDVVATCRPDGLVEVGFGRRKIYVDVTGDTLHCSVARPNPEAPAEATVGVGTHTTWNGLYLYPATNYPFDVIKAIKKADRGAVVRYPWSIFRIVLVTALAILLIASAAGAGGSSTSTGDQSGGSSSLSGGGVDQPNGSSTTDGGASSQSGSDSANSSSGSDSGSGSQSGSGTAGGSTSGSPPTPPAQATNPSEAANDAQRTVAQFWQNINDGNYSGAYELYAGALQNHAGDEASWVQGENDDNITGVSMQISQGTVNGDTAKIPVNVTTSDQSGCSRFTGEYTVRRTGSGWRLVDENLTQASC